MGACAQKCMGTLMGMKDKKDMVSSFSCLLEVGASRSGSVGPNLVNSLWIIFRCGNCQLLVGFIFHREDLR